MLYYRAVVMYVHVGECVRAALVAEQQRVALAVVACPVGILANAYQSAVGVLALARRDSLTYDCAPCVLPKMACW